MSAKQHWPAIAAIAVYWAAVAAALTASVRLNDGRLIYPLDDTYIHMAMAKNVALHHVWGVTRYGFASSTSSPLWTLLLSLTYAVLGVSVVAPLVLNLVAGTLVIVTIDALLRARSARPALRSAVLIATVFLAPLPTLTVVGMEHTLHALATLWLVFAVVPVLASGRPAKLRDLVQVGALGALAVGARYEGLFTLAIVALLLLATRGLSAAAVVGVIGSAPAIVYGLWSVAHGWYFLPNSLLLKGRLPALNASALLSFFSGAPALHNLIANPHLLLLVVGALTLLMVTTTSPIWTEDVYLLLVLAGTALLHVQLALVGWFYRYEAYLVILGAAVFGAIAANRSAALTPRAGSVLRYASAATLLAVVGFPFASRGLNAWRNIPTASSNIYHQQYQMGLFLDRYYRGRSIALNDIGAVSYLADVRLMDIYGLASLDIVRLRRAHRYDSAEIGSALARESTDVAIIYPSWLGEYGGVPAQWTRVGEWAVRDNVVLGSNSVAFYAVDEGKRAQLTDNLRRFAPVLPQPVVQSGAYTR